MADHQFFFELGNRIFSLGIQSQYPGIFRQQSEAVVGKFCRDPFELGENIKCRFVRRQFELDFPVSVKLLLALGHRQNVFFISFHKKNIFASEILENHLHLFVYPISAASAFQLMKPGLCTGSPVSGR